MQGISGVMLKYEKVLGIKQQEEVEETIAANTLGTVIHNTLEDLYKPLEGQILTIGAVRITKSPRNLFK